MLKIEQMADNSQPTIVMLEQDADDRLLTRIFFGENSHPVNVQFVEDGKELLGYLDSCSKNNTPLPPLILMTMQVSAPAESMNLLQQLKTNAGFRHIPVVMLTGSMNPAIAKECYAAGATSVIEKPSGSQATSDKIASFIRYWFETVGL